MRQYDISVGHLTLEHNYPLNKSDPHTVSVDINAVLGNLRWEDLRVGSWLNVLGYIRESTPQTPSFSSSQQSSQQSNEPPARVPRRPVYVEAIMVFPAGAIALGEYERILRTAQDIESRMTSQH